MLRPRAFTLIELLVVVAVIAILAAIALPNFLEAQTRAKVSRVAADLRTIATALETYRDRPAWETLRKNGMEKDFSWQRQGAEYEELYAQLIA